MITQAVSGVVSAAAGLILGAGCATAQPSGNPLPSWNDGPAKQAIVDFVKTTTTKGSPQFVPPAERIATFDQDGTLWVEHPIYSQVMYCLDRVPALVAAETGTEGRRTVQDRHVRRPRGHREADHARPRKDRGRHAHRHDGGAVPGRGEAVARQGQGPALETALHRTDLPADAGSPALPARQRLQDLHRHRRRPGLRARLLRANLRHPARAGGRHRAGDDSTVTTRTANRSSPKSPSSCSTTTMPASPRAST